MGTKNICLSIVLLTSLSACSELSHHEDVDEPCLIYSYDKGVGKGGGAFYVRGESGIETCNKVIHDENGKIIMNVVQESPGLCRELIEEFKKSNIKSVNELDHVMELVDRENNELVWDGVFRASDASGFLDKLKSRCPQ